MATSNRKKIWSTEKQVGKKQQQQRATNQQYTIDMLAHQKLNNTFKKCASFWIAKKKEANTLKYMAERANEKRANCYDRFMFSAWIVFHF